MKNLYNKKILLILYELNSVSWYPPKGYLSEFNKKEIYIKMLSSFIKGLRKEIKDKTDLGQKISSLMSSGSLVEDSIVNKLIEEIISDKRYENKFIFDGYPRNIDQANNLNNVLKKTYQD